MKFQSSNGINIYLIIW